MHHMEAVQAELGSLSQAAQLILDYIVRYGRNKGNRVSEATLDRSLSGQYPLFRYLFPSREVRSIAIEELRRAGWLDGVIHGSGANWKERLRRSVRSALSSRPRTSWGEFRCATSARSPSLRQTTITSSL